MPRVPAQRLIAPVKVVYRIFYGPQMIPDGDTGPSQHHGSPLIAQALVLPHILARVPSRSGGIEDIVKGLKGKTDRQSEAMEPGAVRLIGPGNKAAALGRNSKQDTGLCGVNRADRRRCRGNAAIEIRLLTRRKTTDPDRFAERRNEAIARLRRSGTTAGNEAKSLGQQRDPSQDRGAFPKNNVIGWLPPAQRGVIHGGQIVENERSGVDQFDGAGKVKDCLGECVPRSTGC